MSTKRRNRRTLTPAPGGVPAAGVAQAPLPAVNRPSAPHYRWRQFPVFFALALGLFIGFEGGVLASWVENSLVTTLFSAIVAVLLGFGIARLAVVWMISRNWVKPRPKRR